jgi:hypothetical protein
LKRAFGVNDAIYVVQGRRLTFSLVRSTRRILLVSSRHVFFCWLCPGLCEFRANRKPAQGGHGCRLAISRDRTSHVTLRPLPHVTVHTFHRPLIVAVSDAAPRKMINTVAE